MLIHPHTMKIVPLHKGPGNSGPPIYGIKRFSVRIAADTLFQGAGVYYNRTEYDPSDNPGTRSE